MKWNNQNKWMICWLIWILPFVVFAGNGSLPLSTPGSSCQKSFFGDRVMNLGNRVAGLLRSFKSSKPMHRIAQLDQTNLAIIGITITKDTFDQLPFLVFKHPLLFNKYRGEKGLFLYAMVYFGGDVEKAMSRVKTELSIMEIKKLEWLKYDWPMKNLNVDYSWKIFIAGGRNFRGMEGFALVADLYFNGDMIEAFNKTVEMSRMSAEEFTERFRWKRFIGPTYYFYPLRRKITNSQGLTYRRYRLENGLDTFAATFYSGNIGKSKLDMKLVLNAREWEYLQWPEDTISNEQNNNQRDLTVNLIMDSKLNGQNVLNGHNVSKKSSPHALHERDRSE